MHERKPIMPVIQLLASCSVTSIYASTSPELVQQTGNHHQAL
jgi:hypothetical protein